MAEIDPLSKATTLPGGARFYKCALQVNPHHYASTYRGQQQSTTEEAYTVGLLDQANEQGITVIAITDHNHVGSVGRVQALAHERGIHVFPGFELTSSEGVHVLCLYPSATADDQLGRYLGEFGIRTTTPSSEPSNKPFVDVLKCVRTQGGITIAAHVTNEGGLLQVLQGQPRIRAWCDDNLLAIQIPGPADDLPQDAKQIVQNKNPEYRRTRQIAIVNAKDVAKPEDLADPSASCWIKMSEVSIEGLRQAFLDPGSRIRLASDPPPEEHAEFLALGWQGGFLDGTTIRFNENLNVLIGGRGTGKSTIVESLRYVLGLDALGEEARRGHEGIVRFVLKNGTKISLSVRSHRPAKQDYRIERTIPNPPVVRDGSGQVLNLTPREVLPLVEVYGQHEISELTKSREKLTLLLDRFKERDDSIGSRKSRSRSELDKTRTQLQAVRKELKQIEEKLAALPSLEDTLKRFQQAGLEERLKEQSLLVREERVLNTIPERLEPLREVLARLREKLPIDRAFLAPKALEGLPGKDILARANDVLDQLSREGERIAADLERALAAADTGMATVRSAWNERKAGVQAAYEKILRELQKSRVDGEEFIRLRRQIEELRPLKEREQLLRRTEKEHEERRRNALVEWEDVKAAEFRLLERAATKVTRKLADRVRVQVDFAGNREPLMQLMRDQIGGRLSEALDAIRAHESLSLAKLVTCCREGAESVARAYQIPPAQADRLAKATPEVLMQIEELDLPSTTTIQLNVAAAGEPAVWRALDDLSTGQKATAVLLLLLLESDAPLVVDQPEDDLDNRFITEGVVPRMRHEKRRRQFVFSTHNANIPVLGDAELILGLTASGEASHGSAKVPQEHMGSIDSRPVRELVEELLEGGKEAFEMRRLKYGF